MAEHLLILTKLYTISTNNAKARRIASTYIIKELLEEIFLIVDNFVLIYENEKDYKERFI